MRMRRKKNLDQRLRLVSNYLIDIGETAGGYNGIPFSANRLDLAGLFGNEHPTELEIGCGKGQFAAAIAAQHPERNFLAVEVNPSVIVQACEKAKAAGLVTDIWQMRAIIANTLDLVRYEPQDKAAWDKAYEKYLSIVNNK